MWEKLLSFVSKLIEENLLPFVLIFVVGVVLMVAAATGGSAPLHIPATVGFWRYATAAVGLLLVFFAIGILMLRGNTSARVRSRAWFGVMVQSPQGNTAQRSPIQIILSMKRSLPKDAEMWAFTVRGGGKTPCYWPHRQLTLVGQTWQGNVKASRANPTANRLFAVFIVGKDGQALIRHYKAAGEAISVASSGKASWPGIDTLTSDIVQITDRIEVELRV